MHSTNYTDTFIEVSEDCKADAGKAPPERDNKSIARMQYELIINAPYKYTSDDLIFTIYAKRNKVKNEKLSDSRKTFFSKGQACLRASPLAKTYGWGIHFDSKSRIAIFGKESKKYAGLKSDRKLKQLKAMRNKK